MSSRPVQHDENHTSRYNYTLIYMRYHEIKDQCMHLQPDLDIYFPVSSLPWTPGWKLPGSKLRRSDLWWSWCVETIGKKVEIKKWQSLPERAGQPVPLQLINIFCAIWACLLHDLYICFYWGEDIQKQAILLADDAGQKGKREISFGNLTKMQASHSQPCQLQSVASSGIPFPVSDDVRWLTFRCGLSTARLRRRSFGLWAWWKLGSWCL